MTMIQKPSTSHIHFSLLLLLAFLIPSGFYFLEGAVIGLLVLSWLFGIRGYRHIRHTDRPIQLLLLFFVLIVSGLLYTTDMPNQLAYISKKLAFLLIPLCFIGVVLSKERQDKIKTVFIFSTFVFILIADIYAIADYLLTKQAEIRIGSNTYNKFTYYGLTRLFKGWHPTYSSLFLNLALVFIYQLFYKKETRLHWALLSLFGILNIFLLNSFIGILSFFALVALFLFKLLQRQKKLLLLSAIVFIGAISLLYLYNPLHYSKIDQFKATPLKITDKEGERNTLTLRVAKWQSSLQLFAKSPLLGTSNGNYRDALYEQYLKNDFLFCAEQRYSSHNQYLYTLVSNGIVGLFLLLAILTTRYWYRHATQVLGLFLLIGSIFFLTEDILARQQGLVFFIFFYILLTRPTPPKLI